MKNDIQNAQEYNDLNQIDDWKTKNLQLNHSDFQASSEMRLA